MKGSGFQVESVRKKCYTFCLQAQEVHQFSHSLYKYMYEQSIEIKTGDGSNSKNIQSVMYVGPRVLLHKRISHRNIRTTWNSSISTRLLPSISNMLKAISNPLFGSATEKTPHNNATWRMETIFTKWLLFFTKLNSTQGLCDVPTT